MTLRSSILFRKRHAFITPQQHFPVEWLWCIPQWSNKHRAYSHARWLVDGNRLKVITVTHSRGLGQCGRAVLQTDVEITCTAIWYYNVRVLVKIRVLYMQASGLAFWTTYCTVRETYSSLQSIHHMHDSTKRHQNRRYDRQTGCWGNTKRFNRFIFLVCLN